ncbi:MAG: hypothetical protein NVS2B17_21330 [Candidatus Velthaea sp.]
MTGIAIVVVFLALAVLMIARKLPALLAVPIMAVAIGAIAGAGPGGVADIFAKGAVQLAPTIATLIFGALLSRVVLSTGIAETIVTVAAEFGGDRPMVLALVLCGAVALLFTSVTGLGAIIMIGTIVLPVMMTVGVPRATAATLFLMAFGLGYIFNLAQWKFYGQIFGVDQSAFGTYIYVLAAIEAVVIVVYAIVRTRTTRDYATFALSAPPGSERRRVHPIALITPILPVLIYKGLGVDATIAFALAALFGVLVTRPRDLVQTLVGSWIRGLEDVAPAIILMLGIGMLLYAAKLPAVAAALAPLITAVAPRTPLAYVLVFGLLSPLALYRGPLNIYGVGIGVFTVLATLHVVPAAALVAAVMAVVQVQNVCDPTNTQNVWVANFTGVGVDRITRLTLPYQVAVATLAATAVVVFGSWMFGSAPFALAQPVDAAEAGGLTAPPAAARTVAVVAGPGAEIAADEIVRAIERGWPGYHAFVTREDPGARDCARKTYAAALRVSLSAGAPVDVGAELLDCGGWSVDQWHAQGADVRKLALDVLFRARVWSREHPLLAQNVFERGLAYDPQHDGPTYFYTLFKPADGYMRAFVRPGGPAYTAGLRTGDVIDKLDGRFWWEYGTYQTQLRAYDGKPHSFEVQRGGVGGPVLQFALGSAYDGR